MKWNILIVGMLLGGISHLWAAEPFVAPAFVKELEDLEAVKAEASKENKGVSFLLMEPGST